MSGKHGKQSNGERAKKREKSRRKRSIKKKIILICTIVLLCLLAYLAYYFYNKGKNMTSIREAQEYMEVKDEKENVVEDERIDKVKELQSQNSDIKGWIQIENTNINYPLLQGEDNEFYADHDYKKEKSVYGSIYLKNICNIYDETSNLVIYGHHMKDTEMFNNLLKYKDQSFYNEHKTVEIITDKDVRKYAIVSVFKSRIFYQNETNVFRYYNIVDFENEDEYNDFISNAKKLQFYDTGVDAKFGEQLITMITCESSTENGRLVVVAKRILDE